MSDYKTDLNELQKHKENIALDQYDDLVNRCTLSPVPFLKKNYEFKKLRERRTDPNITTFLGVTWLKICMLCGIKQNQNAEVWQDITNLVFSYYSDLTVEEIFKAFELERFGEYHEKTKHYQFFNSEYVSAVLKKYRAWKQITKIQHNITKSESVALLPDISESQKQETLTNGIIRVFNEFKSTKIIELLSLWVFDYLQEKGHIQGANTPKLIEYYSKKMEEAKIQVQKELEIEKSNSNFIRRKTITREIEEVLHGNSSKVIVATKKIVLREYFEKLINENIEIESLLNR